MREPADDSGAERKSRRRGRGAPAAGLAGRLSSATRRGPGSATDAGRAQGRRDTAKGSAAGGRHSASSGAVFTPGYTRGAAEPDPRGAGRPDPGQGAPPGSASSGPVRGYAPLPGQPPPIYPPGQFAAWNRRRDGQPGGAVQPGAQGAQPPGSGAAGLQRAEPPRPGGAAERYYAEDADPGIQPDYPVLAVNDPAADVTSTQTWRAVGEGRSTGIWTAPPELRVRSATPAATSDGTAGPRIDTGPHSRVTTGPNPRVTTGPNPRVTTGPNPRITTGPNPRITTGPNPRVSESGSLAATEGGTGTDRPAATGRRRRGTGTGRARRRGPVSVKLAMAVALLLVLAAAGTLAYAVLHDSPKPRLAGRSPGKPSPSASASPSLGPYGDIASRQSDPQPLTLAELYPTSFTTKGATVTVAATSLGSNCAAEIVGATLQSAVGAAGCTQVARATYVEPAGSLMGTIGVLNLSTGDAAKTAAASADASDFISQLTASSGPAQQLGQSTGIEEALAKGHYLILIWAEFTNLRTPTAQDSSLIENFMTEVLQNTANKSLTNRMLTGTP
jgi:hypothetical protein